MGFLNGCLVKKCDVEIEVKHLEPYVIYEPTFDVYYILHGDNTVVIVKEGTTFEVCVFINFNTPTLCTRFKNVIVVVKWLKLNNSF